MSGAINWDAVVAWLALSAAAFALLAWQYKADPSKTRGWLGGSAISLELLAAGLAVNWALKNADGAFCTLFIAGVIGLAVAKATLLPGVITASKRGQYGALFVGSIAAIGAYLTVYLLGAMSGLESDSQRTAAALANSAPLQAIDSEIASTRERLSGLASFSDPVRAHNEETATAQQATAIASQRQRLAADIAAKRGELQACPRKHMTRCIRPIQGQIAALESQLNSLPETAASGNGYAGRHQSYIGLQNHLTALETRRAELLTSDSTAATGLAVGVSERMIAWLTGLSEERARALKWLLLVAVFDLLSAAIRLFSEMMHGVDADAGHVRKYAALLSAGLAPDAASKIVSGNQTASAHYAPMGFAPATGSLRARMMSTPPNKDTTPLNDPVAPTLGEGVCKHCGSIFERLTWNHAYCSESCRVSAWESKTGRKLKKGRKA